MNDIQLQNRRGSSVPVHATGEGDNGFANQPDYGKRYNPNDDKRGTNDMYRLGRKQESKRRFRYFSIAGYVVVLGNTWDFAVVTSTFGLANGGIAGTIWMSIIVCIGMVLSVLSLAEVASMAPISGGQYHWVAEIAPKRVWKQMSYVVGWMALVGWQVAVPASGYIFAQQIVALYLSASRVMPAKDGKWHGSPLHPR
ncbi:hypothetical protein LTR49_018019 [Elasticomyces elasticus]|nr:hypothetical protein LTR49_018019 [Elasticomyces elasticus]